MIKNEGIKRSITNKNVIKVACYYAYKENSKNASYKSSGHPLMTSHIFVNPGMHVLKQPE